MTWLESLILGAVQGVTEFLPISSDGHLIVTAKIFERFTGVYRGEDENVFLFLMLHVATAAAILAHYRKEVLAGARGLLGSTHVAEPFLRPNLIRVGVLVAVATAVLIPDKLFFMKWMKAQYENPVSIGIGFWVTAAALAVTASQLAGGDKGPSETTYLDALIVGIAQAVAPLPGVSRSGLTVAIALALGFRRAWAVQFSLMLAVPAIAGAAVFAIEDVDRSTLTGDRVAQTIAAMVVAGIVGYLAIVWLLRVVRAGRLWYFSVYLIVLGLVVMLGFSARGPRDGRDAPTAGRPAGAGPGRPDDRGVSPGREGALDRADGARPRAD